MARIITGKNLLVLALLILAGFFVFRFFFGSPGHRPPRSTAPVRTAQALAQDVPHYLEGLGTVQPLADVLVTSRVSGHLQAVHFTEGQRVHAGDLLAEIDPRPFQAALSQARGTLARDEAQLANARKDRNRYAGLVKNDYVSRQAYDQQDASVRELEGTVTADRAAVENAALNLAYSRITAPVSGRLGLRIVDPGTFIPASDSTGIVRITEVTPCSVVFTLPESVVPLVTHALHQADKTRSLGKEPEKPVVEAWSRDQKELLATGELLTVDNRIATDTGTIRLKAVFPNTDESLFPNEFVNARLRVRILKNAVTVPPSAVQLGASGNYVFVVDSSSRAHLRQVTVGISTGAITVIEKGLSTGETVVVDGVDRLREDTQVHVAAKLETKLLESTNSPLETETGLHSDKKTADEDRQTAGSETPQAQTSPSGAVEQRPEGRSQHRNKKDRSSSATDR